MVRINWESIPNKSLGANVFCSREVQHKFYGIFNKNYMSALSNFAKKENSTIYFSSIDNDMFHNTKMSVFDNKEIAGPSMEFPLKLDVTSRDNFAQSMRNIYNCAAEAVKSFAKK